MNLEIVERLNNGRMNGEQFIATPEFMELVTKLKQKTARWKKTMGYLDERAEPSDKIKALKKILSSRRVSRDTANLLLDIMQLYIPDENFDLARETSFQLTYTTGVVVVPITASPNRHDYPLNQPAVCYRGTRFFSVHGFMGNEMTDDGTFIRPATDEEILQLCTETAKANPQTIALLLNALF